MLAGEDTVVEKPGHKCRKAEEIEDDVDAPRADYVDAELRGEARGALMGARLIGDFATAGAFLSSGGAVAAILPGAGTAGGDGALIAAVLGEFINEARQISSATTRLSWPAAAGANKGRHTREAFRARSSRARVGNVALLLMKLCACPGTSVA